VPHSPFRVVPSIVLLLVLAATLQFAGARAAESVQAPDAAPAPAGVQLVETDFGEITLAVLKAHPLLASSRGIKYAAARRPPERPGFSPVEIADVIFHPHVDSGGVKQAYQVQCRRPVPDGSWDCPDVDIRRYLTLQGQDFEVRVMGDIGNDAARALIEASRVAALACAPNGTAAPATAMVVFPVEDGYLVGWETKDGQAGISVLGRLRPAGDLGSAHEWQVRVLTHED
jgi:hypothetical protein